MIINYFCTITAVHSSFVRLVRTKRFLRVSCFLCADQGESAELKSAVDSSGQSQEPSNAVPESPAPPSSEKPTQEEGAAPNETPTTALKGEPGKLPTETGKKQKNNNDE